jgi:hypothetical protein
MRMWVDPAARKKLFEKLFSAPLPAGVDLPKSLGLNFSEVLVEYPNTVTKENPWGDDGITLDPESHVRHAVLRGMGTPKTSIAILRGAHVLASAEVGLDGRWTAQADLSLSRTELLSFVVSKRSNAVEEGTALSYCTDQTDAGPDSQVEVRAFVLIAKDDNLSRLARLLSGNSRNYVTIFKKNKQLIYEKDLIFPNQIFEVPSYDEWRFKPIGVVEDAERRIPSESQ